MPRDTHTERLVIALFDTGAQGLVAEVTTLDAALDMAADFSTGDTHWQATDMRYLDGDRVGEPVQRWAEMVAEEVRERDREAIREARGIFW